MREIMRKRFKAPWGKALWVMLPPSPEDFLQELFVSGGNTSERTVSP
jgi:hypothetical protein